MQGYNITLTNSHVQEAIKQSKNNNSQVPDKLNIRHLKHIGPLGLAFLTSMFKTALNKNIIPHSWTLANIVPIPKPNKDTDTGTSYRPISLLSVIAKTLEKSLLPAPNDTAYKRWSCHSELKLLCKLCRTSPAPAMGARFTVFWACRPCGHAGWLALLLTKAGDVETNPGPTTLNKKVWICDICHKQIHVRKRLALM